MNARSNETPANGAAPSTDDRTAERATKVARVIRRASIGAAAFGVILSPIPLADELVLLPAYAVLSARIARARGLELRAIPWRPIGLTALAGLGVRAAVNLTVSYIPFVAAAANAASAVALTQFFGRYVDAACQGALEGHVTHPLGWRKIVESIRPRPSRA
jgi:uncharacterized protein (DUF697 family)